MLDKALKIFLALSVTVPVLFLFALTVFVKDSKTYCEGWKELFLAGHYPDSSVWWIINSCLFFILFCLGILLWGHRYYMQSRSSITITVKSYSKMTTIESKQVLSFVLPLLTFFVEDLSVTFLFFCVLLLCCFMIITNYNNTSYNILCRLLGYRHYEVHTQENTLILLSKKCIRNNNEITAYIEITDDMGIVVNNK